jgi:RNA polymerase sigma-70 factor, ECF subfamily
MPATSSSLSAGGFAVVTSDHGRESAPLTGQPGGRWTERRLILAARRGDETAQAELFRSYWRPMYRAAYLIVQDAASAEDIAQEAFLAAIRNLDRFDLRRRLGPWLHRIAVNRAIDVVRARQLRREVSGEAEPVGFDDQESRLDDRTSAALADLPVEQRAVVVMRYLLDYTPGEIAKALELPRGTVNSRLRRGLDRLAAELEGNQ